MKAASWGHQSWGLSPYHHIWYEISSIVYILLISVCHGDEEWGNVVQHSGISVEGIPHSKTSAIVVFLWSVVQSYDMIYYTFHVPQGAPLFGACCRHTHSRRRSTRTVPFIVNVYFYISYPVLYIAVSGLFVVVLLVWYCNLVPSNLTVTVTIKDI